MKSWLCLILIVIVGFWGHVSAESTLSVVKDIAWNPTNSSEIAIAYQDGRVVLYQPDSQTTQSIFTPPSTLSLDFAQVAWHPQGQFLAAGIGNTVYIWRRAGTEFQLYDQMIIGSTDGIAHMESGDKPESIISLDWSYDGSLVGISSLSGALNIWCMADKQILFTSAYLDAQPLAWSPNRQVLLAGTQYIDYTDRTPIFMNIPVGVAVVTSIKWKSDDRFFAFGDVYGFIYIVDSLQPEKTKIYRPFLDGDASSITDIAWIAGQNKIAEVNTDGRFVVLNAETGQVDYVSDQNGELNAVDVDPSGMMLAYGGENASGEGMRVTIVPVSSLLLTSSITPTYSISRVTSSTDAQSLRDMLLPAGCTQVCYFGIQPEITTREEFEAFLSDNRIEPYVISPEDLDNTHYEWDLPSQTVFKPENGARGEVIFNQGKIVRITLPLDIPLSVVYEVFGYPDTVTNYRNNGMTFIYKQLGMAISLSRLSNQTRTSDFILASADSQYETYLIYPPGEPVDQPCSTYGMYPCIVPTATPFP